MQRSAEDWAFTWRVAGVISWTQLEWVWRLSARSRWCRGGVLAGQSVISRKPTAGRAGMGSAQAPSYDACGGCQAHRGNQQRLRAKAHETLTSDHRWTEHRTSDSSSAFTRMTRSTAHCTRTSSLLFRMMNH